MLLFYFNKKEKQGKKASLESSGRRSGSGGNCGRILVAALNLWLVFAHLVSWILGFYFFAGGWRNRREGGRLGDRGIELPDPSRSRRGCSRRLRSAVRRMRNFTCFRDPGKQWNGYHCLRTSKRRSVYRKLQRRRQFQGHPHLLFPAMKMSSRHVRTSRGLLQGSILIPDFSFVCFWKCWFWWNRGLLPWADHWLLSIKRCLFIYLFLYVLNLRKCCFLVVDHWFTRELDFLCRVKW